jgi:uncharacterized protein (TIGR03437 family)
MRPLKRAKPTRIVSAVLMIGFAAIAAADSGKLPLAFEPNRGQGDRASEFLARGSGYAIGVRRDGAVISLRDKNGKGELTTLRLIGASPTSRVAAKEPLPGKVNYFIGSNPKAWHTDIPTYAKIEIPGAYPGIDMVYYGAEGQLEFDFLVRAGGDASRIAMKFEAPARPHLDANGDLVVGALRQHRPVAYQMTPESGRKAVDCRYIVHANQEVGILLGAYDHRRQLVIDPVISYATYIGGAVNDGIASIKVDAGGNLYMAGFTSSANFPVKGAAQSAYGGTNSPLLQGQFGDAFVAKLNPAGTALVYATYLGGSGDDFATSIAVDASGNAYVVGATQSANFPTSTGAFQKNYRGFTDSDNNGFYNPGDGFAVKLNPSGNALLYSTYLGGTLNDLPMGVAVDSSGDAIVVGATESTDFPTTSAALMRQYRGSSNVGSAVAGDGFVAILNPAGTALNYSTFLGGKGHDAAKGIAVDAQNNMYICGMTSSSDFPTTPGALLTTYLGDPNSMDFNNPVGHGFVTKLSSQGALIYSTFLGGSLREAASAIAVDSSGAVYVTGSTASTDFPTTAGAPQGTYKGRGSVGSFGDITLGDAFALKLNPAGSALVYSTYLGGNGDDAGTDIGVDTAGNAYVTGFTISNNFPITPDALQPQNAGFGGQGLAPNPDQGFDFERVRNTGDAFLVKLSSSGGLTYSSFFGGSRDDAGLAIAIDPAGNPYVAGNTLSLGLATSSGALQSTFGGMGAQWPRGDGFIVKFDFGGKVVGAPAAVSVVAGFPTTGNAGATLTPAFAVEVVDPQGLKVPGVNVAFTASGATVSPTSATTDAQGRASAVVTLGATAGTAKVTATVAGIPAATANINVVIAAPTGPNITLVANAFGDTPLIAPNTWVEVKGTNLSPPTSNRIWQDPDFVNGKLPTQMDGVSVTINGKTAYTYFISPTQVNVLTPPDPLPSSVQVVLTIGGIQSNVATVAAAPQSLSFFEFVSSGGLHYVYGRHGSDNTIIGPTSLFPGLTSPVKPGERIYIAATGFGNTDTPIVSGALSQSGSLPLPLPVIKVGGIQADVSFAGLVSVGTYQINFVVPLTAPDGDLPLTATYNGLSIQSNLLIAVKN